MTAVLPAALTYGQVKWIGIAAHADGADADDRPDAVFPSGSVTFTPTVAGPLLYMGESPVTIFPVPVTYQIVNGTLQDSTGRPLISLVANDSPMVTPTGWTWTARYDLANGLIRGTFAFDLPGGTVVDLTKVSPVAISNGVQIIQGPPGKDGENGTGGTGTAGVSSVNGKAGTVFLVPADIGAASTQQLSDGLATKVNSSTYTAGIANAKDRTQHTGQQPASTISDFAAAVLAASPVSQIVVHGDNPNVNRPATNLPVIWFGTVDPVYADALKNDVTIPVTAGTNSGGGTGAPGTYAATYQSTY